VDKDIGQLLSWYANGTLTGADRERVEAALRDDPRARALLEWEQSLRQAVKNDPDYDIPEDHGLDRVMQRIRAESAQPAAAKQAPASAVRKAKPATPSRFAEWFRWSPALALACGIVAVQFGVIVHMTQLRGEESEYSGVRGVGQHKDAYLRVSFKPESTESDLRALIRGVHAEIVSGPSQLGDYYLVIAPEAVQSALAALQSSKLVESAEVVNALPSRPS